MDLLSALNQLTTQLDAAIATKTAGARPPDAIDLELGRPPRTTAVQSIRNSQAMLDFETAWVNGQIRQDALVRILDLVKTGIGLLAPGIAG